jgi:hypothetical protein
VFPQVGLSENRSERQRGSLLAWLCLIGGLPWAVLVTAAYVESVSNVLVVCEIEGLRIVLQAFVVRLERSVEEPNTLFDITGSPFACGQFVLIRGFHKVVFSLRF